MLSPLVWAYVGDSVYEMFIRTNLINNSNAKPHKLHVESIKYVKAKAQAEIFRETVVRKIPWAMLLSYFYSIPSWKAWPTFSPRTR